MEVLTGLNRAFSQSAFPINPLFENSPLHYAIFSNIIELRSKEISTRIKAFELLNKILNFEYTPLDLRSVILKYQIGFVLKLYRGFSEKQYYKVFQAKAQEMISICLNHKNSVDLLSGVLLYARLIMIHEENIQVINYLEEIKKEFDKLGIGDINKFLDRKIDIITELSLQEGNLERLEQLLIEQYIKEAVNFMHIS